VKRKPNNIHKEESFHACAVLDRSGILTENCLEIPDSSSLLKGRWASLTILCGMPASSYNSHGGKRRQAGYASFYWLRHSFGYDRDRTFLDCHCFNLFGLVPLTRMVSGEPRNFHTHVSIAFLISGLNIRTFRGGKLFTSAPFWPRSGFTFFHLSKSRFIWWDEDKCTYLA
jgi:hypothetical protein